MPASPPTSAAEEALAKWLTLALGIYTHQTGWAYSCTQDLLLQEGTWYREARSHDIIVPRMCYLSSLALAESRDDLVYVEGYARDSSIGAVFEHAWCATADGKVIDSAWDEPGEAYLGIPIGLDTYRACTKRSGADTVLFAHGGLAVLRDGLKVLGIDRAAG